MSERNMQIAAMTARLDALVEKTAEAKLLKAQAAARARFPGSVDVAVWKDRITALLQSAGADKMYVDNASDKRYEEMRSQDPTLAQIDRNEAGVVRILQQSWR